MNNFKYSNIGLKITEGFEGLRLVPYQDGNGIWTNGYGNTHNVDPSVTITQFQAESDLATNIAWAMSVVNKSVTVQLNQQEADALCDFVFNVGSGNFSKSSLLRDINAGHFELAAADFEKWSECAGKVCAGLMRRRVAEAAEFNS